jgi:hypothetical protein
VQVKTSLNDDSVDMLQEILDDDEGMAKQIVEASKTSMGYDISEIDMLNVQTFAERVINLEEYRQRLREYLNSRMHSVAPNLSSLVGEIVGARLISHAGSLTNLAKYPASTVQILGAEKALFRALKTKGNTPKYGLIFHSSFIGRASQKNKVIFPRPPLPLCITCVPPRCEEEEAVSLPLKTKHLCNNFSEFDLWIRFELFNTEANPRRPPLSHSMSSICTP